MLLCEDIVDEVPVFRSWVHPGVLVDLLVFKVGVGKWIAADCHWYELFPFQTYPEPLTNLSIKDSKIDNFVCILDSTKYMVELVIETFFFWVISQGISSNQGTVSTTN